MKTATGLATLLLTSFCTAASALDFRTVALSGDPAPGAAAGVNFSSFNRPALNAAGQTAFTASLTGAGVDVTNRTGIYSEGSGALAQVARSGEPAPGGAADVNFSHFDNLIVLNALGQTAFTGFLTGAGADATNRIGIYSEGSGVLAPVARIGEQAPGEAAGVRFIRFSSPVLNASGQTAFTGTLAGVGVGRADTGIYSDGSGVLAPVARAGEQAPGVTAGANFSRFSTPVLNASGQTAFTATLIGVGVDGTNNTGIYSEGSGILAPVAREGEQAPGVTAGVNFSHFSDPVLNASGQTAFTATLIGVGVDETNNTGIYSEGSGVLASVARAGEQAPGADAGVNFSHFGDPVLNASGQTAFRGFLTGVGVEGTNDTGIYAMGADGLLVEIARSGNLFDVDDDPLVDDLRTITSLSFLTNTGNEDGRGSGFNDSGQLAFVASFTDGSRGIFVSNLVAVPEPGSLSLLAMGCVRLLARRRR